LNTEDIIMSTLSHRDRELVALGAALAANCIPCIEYHVPEARKAGLSDGEIAEAIALAEKIKRVPAGKVADAANAALGTMAAAQGAEAAACCGPDKAQMAQDMAKAAGCCPPAMAEQAAKSCC
jgi:4-carboxymuconolactone decarboxylase